MIPRDERIPGQGEPLLSYVDSAILQAQITATLLAAQMPEGYTAWDPGFGGNERGDYSRQPNADLIHECSEQAREIMTTLGLFRFIPGVEYGRNRFK